MPPAHNPRAAYIEAQVKTAGAHESQTRLDGGRAGRILKRRRTQEGQPPQTRKITRRFPIGLKLHQKKVQGEPRLETTSPRSNEAGKPPKNAFRKSDARACGPNPLTPPPPPAQTHSRPRQPALPQISPGLTNCTTTRKHRNAAFLRKIWLAQRAQRPRKPYTRSQIHLSPISREVLWSFCVFWDSPN